MLAHGGVMPLFGDFFEGQDTAIRSRPGSRSSRAVRWPTSIAFLEAIQE
jgi:hypothetical protein